MYHPFTPLGATVSLAVTGTTGSVAVTTINDLSGKSLRFYNAGPNTAFIDFGVSTIEATTADMPLPAGAIEIITVGPTATHVAAICASGQTATLYITSGVGV